MDPEAPIPIYCINLPGSRDRRLRMTWRFDQAGVLDAVRFIRAIDGRSPSVEDHVARMRGGPGDGLEPTEVACWLSHIRALRTFLRETPATTPSAIVFEDDVLLHREWHTRLAAVLDNLPQDAPVCALGYNDENWDRPPETWEGFAWAGLEPDRRVLIHALNRQWGAHAYWISRSHARTMLDRLAADDPTLLRVPESIQKVRGAFAAFPALAIQDGSPSTIRGEPGRIRTHRIVNSSWGVENYLAGDDEHMLAQRSEDAPTICLCALVWNDAELIDRLASSVEGLVDSWVICDTGSTDGTPERVAKAFAGIPGRLYQDAWQDDGTNRSLLFERARGAADYLLVMDASHSITLREQLDRLDADAYRPLAVESRTGWAPMLVRADLPWRAVGAINAEIECDRPYRTDQLRQVVVRRDESDDHRRADLDRRLGLANHLLADRPADRSLSLSIAELTRELGDDKRAIELYLRRLELGGATSELWEAMYRHAVLVSDRDWDRGVNLLLETWEYLPSRPEPLWALAHGYRLREEFALAGVFSTKGLRVPTPEMPPPSFRSIYDWGLAWEWSLAAYKTGDARGAARMCGRLLSDPTIPDDVLAEMKEHYWRSRDEANARGWQPGDTPDAPSLFSLLPDAEIAEFRLDLDRGLVQSDPSVTGDGERLRALVRVSEASNSWAISYWEAEIDSDLSVVSAHPISDRRGQGAAPMAAFQRCYLVRSGSGFLVVAHAKGSPGGSAPAVVMPLSDGDLGPSQVLVADGTASAAGWAPFAGDGELRFLSSLDPVTVLSVDDRTGAITSTRTGRQFYRLGEERSASPGVAVGGGTLFVTRRVLTGDAVEHRFVLLDEDCEVAGSSAGFFFFNPTRELCSGLATLGEDVVLSVGNELQGSFLIRLPYSAVAALL
jgi:GR25 family glycosyltransferase involved in LPS biosynthesis